MGDKENVATLTQKVPTQKKTSLERISQRISKLQKQKKAIELMENEKKKRRADKKVDSDRST